MYIFALGLKNVRNNVDGNINLSDFHSTVKTP